METFVDREQELDRLESLYTTEKAALAVVYGRRRMGKTTLVLESIKNREDAVYYQATRGSATTDAVVCKRCGEGLSRHLTNS